MFPYKTSISLIIAALFISVNCAAQTEVLDMSGVYNFGELDQLRAQNAILAELAKAAEFKRKISSLGNETNSGSGTSSNLATMTRPAPKSAQVQLVSGFANKMHASISLPDGNAVWATVGTKIPDLGVVKSISINSVMIEQGKQLFSLPFADHGQNLTSATNTPPMRTPGAY